MHVKQEIRRDRRERVAAAVQAQAIRHKLVNWELWKPVFESLVDLRGETIEGVRLLLESTANRLERESGLPTDMSQWRDVLVAEPEPPGFEPVFKRDDGPCCKVAEVAVVDAETAAGKELWNDTGSEGG